MDLVLTDIKQTKKGRYALFFDDRFFFSVDEEVLIKHHLQTDTVFDEADIEILKKESDYNKAREKAFRLLSIRPHSEKELYDKLIRDHDEHTAASIIDRFREMDLINDRDFAASYFEQLQCKGKSFTEIRYKLLQKGISREIIDELLAGSDISEYDTVKGLIESKYRSRLERENGKKLVFDALARRGFSPGVIRTVLGELYEQ